MKLNEDDIYRSSTQYRNWSFTPAQLATQRLKTNQQATARVRAAFARHRARPQADASASESERNGSGIETGSNTPIPPQDGEVDCLTVEEERELLDTFCEKAQDLGNHYGFSTEITATCVQFLRRFYLFNSPMTYEPQVIVRTAMFVANKAENSFPNVSDFASKVNYTAEKVLAPEYLIIQALRYNLDVRHPFRGLKGGHLELTELARANLASLPNATETSKELQARMLLLPSKVGVPATKMTASALGGRIDKAYSLASIILKTIAQLTDAYFLYTPSQIWLSAHLLADEPLTLFYLSMKLPTTHPTYTKLLTTIRACAAIFSSHRSFGFTILSEREKKTRVAEIEAFNEKAKGEQTKLAKKLKGCRNPDKVDLVKLNQAQKRDAVNEDGGLEENKAKRRKIAREANKKEAEEFWGPELPKAENGKK